jgi:hypothetical protein
MAKHKNPDYVTEEVCAARFGALTKGIKRLEKRSDKVFEVLVGPDMKSGIVGDIASLKKNSKSHLTTRDKVIILSALITAAAGCVVAYIK